MIEFSRYGVTNKCISILVSILKAKVNINIKYMNIYGVLACILFPSEFIKHKTKWKTCKDKKNKYCDKQNKNVLKNNCGLNEDINNEKEINKIGYKNISNMNKKNHIYDLHNTSLKQSHVRNKNLYINCNIYNDSIYMLNDYFNTSCVNYINIYNMNVIKCIHKILYVLILYESRENICKNLHMITCIFFLLMNNKVNNKKEKNGFVQIIKSYDVDT